MNLNLQLKLVLRSLLGQKIFSLISIFSLGIAFAAILMISLWVLKEISYDRHIPDHERVYRLTLEYKTTEGYQSHFARVSSRWVMQAGEFIPEIKRTVRFAPKRNTVIRINQNQFYSQKVFESNPSVFDIFGLQLIVGDTGTALSHPNSVIISASMARKYFGNNNVIGESIDIMGEQDTRKQAYLITGVYPDFPETSHMHPDMLLSFTDPNEYYWSFFYVKAHKNVLVETLDIKLQEYLETQIDSVQQSQFKLHLQPIADIHLHSHKDRELELNGNAQSVFIMAGIAIMILIIAMINFINLNIARLFKEVRFLVINKVYGASTNSILQYQLLKSGVLSLAGAIAGIVLCCLAFELLGESGSLGIWEIGNLGVWEFGNLGDWGITIAIILIGLTLISSLSGSLAGFGFITRRFNNSDVSRSQSIIQLFHPQKTFVLRKILIAFQFGISLFLIISTMMANSQMRYLIDKAFGSDREVIIAFDKLSSPVREQYSNLKNELAGNPLIADITASMEVPPSPIKDAFGFTADVEMETEDLIMYVGPVDDNFFQFYNLPIVAGTDFPPYQENVEYEHYIINESAAHMLGWKDPAEAIGKKFQVNFFIPDFFHGGHIVGVVEDFHQTSLHHKIEPTVYFQKAPFFLSFLVKVRESDLKEALVLLEETWQKLLPEYPFDYVLQKQLYNNAYEKENVQLRLSGLFTILAIFISIIGLMGLTTIITEQRTREIGIRKVLGASSLNLIAKLVWEILNVVLLAIAVAIPFSWWMMDHWLNNYAYSIIIENYWWLFLAAAVITTVLVVLVVASMVFVTARRNPADSLRWE